MSLQKVTYIDLVTIIGAQNLNDIQDAIIDLEEWQEEVGEEIPQILANIAPSFSNSASYSAGDCVIVLDKLYQFTADHPAGDWTGADAAEVNVTSLLKEAADSLSGEVDSVKADALAAYATDTATGSIASFSDGADDIPVKDLTVAVEPVQDLHGYDAPWPAGGGKNLVDTVSIESYGGTVSADGLTVTSKVVTASGNSNLMRPMFSNPFDAVTSETFYVSFDIRLLAGTMESFAAQVVGGSSVTAMGISKYAIVPSTTKQRISFFGSPNRDDQVRGIYIQAQNADAAQLEISNIQISKIEDYNYHPYSNICPISGWTGAEVTRTGRNVIPNLATSGTSKGITYTVNADKSISMSGTATGNVFITLFENLLIKAGTYTLKGTNDSDIEIDIRNTTASGANYMWAKMSDTTNIFATDVLIACVVKIPSGKNADGITIYPQLELGSTATDYEPYQGDTYSITFPSEAGTVYGGTLDVTTGKLTVDRAMVDLGTLTWRYQASDPYPCFTTNSLINTINATDNSYKANALCSMYKIESANDAYLGRTSNCVAANSTKQVRVYDTTYTDATGFTAAMSGVQFVYELATPTVYDLTPTEVRTLLAQNNIWADCGDSTVEYRADTKLYIDKKIAALAAAMN